MSNYQDIGNGVLFRNDQRKNDRQPEFTGKAAIDKNEYRLSAWVREKDGRKYFSIAISQQTGGQSVRREEQAENQEDNIPF